MGNSESFDKLWPPHDELFMNRDQLMEISAAAALLNDIVNGRVSEFTLQGNLAIAEAWSRDGGQTIDLNIMYNDKNGFCATFRYDSNSRSYKLAHDTRQNPFTSHYTAY